MDFVLKRPDDFLGLDLDDLRSFAPHELVEAFVTGLMESVGEVIPRDVRLPEEICRAIAARWNDPEFHESLREMLKMAIATALSARLPGSVADLVAGYLVKMLYPAVQEAGDGLLEQLCPLTS